MSNRINLNIRKAVDNAMDGRKELQQTDVNKDNLDYFSSEIRKALAMEEVFGVENIPSYYWEEADKSIEENNFDEVIDKVSSIAHFVVYGDKSEEWRNAVEFNVSESDVDYVDEKRRKTTQ